MQYRVLATDYDGTLATHGKVVKSTILALRRFAAAGGKLIMVTGRELEELGRVFPELDLFQRVVAENGAVLYDPRQNRETLLGPPVQSPFVEALRERSVPVSVGRVIAATVEPYEQAVREAIAQTGLSLEVILNKGSIMVLPKGINKASGLRRALAELELSSADVDAQKASTMPFV